MSKLSSLHIASLVLAAMMLLAIVPWPYGYYVLVRFAAMVVFGYMAFSFYNERRVDMIYLAAVHYILYPGNPSALWLVVEAVKRVR